MISEQALQAAADKLGCDLPSIKAVAEVESSGVAFWTIDGKQVPPVRLEAHWFGKLTGYEYNASHPQISSRGWNPALAAGTHAGAYAQFREAAALDEDAALQSCSWGPFQIMGFHWKALGYPDAAAMVDDMQTEDGQIAAFVRFIEANPALKSALQNHDWYAFARGYNGEGQVDTYAAKMAAAFRRNGGVE